MRSIRFIVLAVATAIVVDSWSGAAAPDKKPIPSDAAHATVRPPSPVTARSNVLTADPWKDISTAPLEPGELDRLIRAELRKDGLQPAPRTSDEQFLRRVTLDLTGRLPLPADVTEFAADPDPKKRDKTIDRLLSDDASAHHWAQYWRDVIAAKMTDRRVLAMVPSFEAWLTEEFQASRPWDQMVRAMLTAQGSISPGQSDPKSGAAFLLAAHLGADQTEERTAEVARVFLGIQIQCAQCHNHPFDEWKQLQFHELAGYFARLRSLPNRAAGALALKLTSLPRGEHLMPGKDDPARGTVTPPKFLNGHKPSPGLGDTERRKALADEITSPDNFWFAAAFVNRVWGELMGQAFCQPVDDMGPGKDVFLPTVLARTAAAFKGSKYDIKGLLRAVCTSEAYQRQIRPGESSNEHLHFAAAYPARLRAEALWQELVSVLGRMGGGPVGQSAGPFAGPYGRRPGLEQQFVNEFRFDPSLKADEIEGSIPQALMLMNNPTLNTQVRATGTNLLGRVLSAYPKDDEAVRIVYLRTLARKPTDRELSRSLAYVKKIGSRSEAFEDLLWALINSTEFQTKR